MGVLNGMLQVLRLWNRAVGALTRLAPPGSAPREAEESANPFLVATTDAAQLQSTLMPTDTLSWRLLSSLVSTLFSLAHTYHTCGSPREALYFVQ